MNFDPSIIEVLKKHGVDKLTEVQQQTIPVMMKGSDVIVQSPTGTGKSLAFLIPIVHYLIKKKDNIKKYKIQAVIITPTRELGLQTQRFLEILGRDSIFLLGGLKIGQKDDLLNPKSVPECSEGGFKLNEFALTTLNDSHKSKQFDSVENCQKSDSRIPSDPVSFQNDLEVSRKAPDEIGSCFSEDSRPSNESPTDLNVSLHHSPQTCSLLNATNDTPLGRGFVIEDIDSFSKLVDTFNPQVAISTPGMLEYVLEHKKSYFDRIEFLILDEADRLLSMGSLRTLEIILSKLPKTRRSGLFTATMDQAIDKLGRLSLRNPHKIAIAQNIVPQKLQIFYMILKPFQKLQMLLVLLIQCPCKRIIFFSSCAAVDFFYDLACRILDRMYADNVVKLFKIHGKIGNVDRQTYLNQFLTFGSTLFCTDVAARGIDFLKIDDVIHFDAPLDPSNFIHRSGRTARNGSEGKSLLFLMSNERSYVHYLKIKRIELQEAKIDMESTQNERVSSNRGSDPFCITHNPLPNNPTDIPRCPERNSIDHRIRIVGADPKNENHDIPNNIEQYLRKSPFNYVMLKGFFDDNLSALSVIAFVSYIRSYKEHCLSYIFNLKELNFDSTAALFFLEKIPNMKEIQQVNFKRFSRIKKKHGSLKEKDPKLHKRKGFTKNSDREHGPIRKLNFSKKFTRKS